MFERAKLAVNVSAKFFRLSVQAIDQARSSAASVRDQAAVSKVAIDSAYAQLRALDSTKDATHSGDAPAPNDG